MSELKRTLKQMAWERALGELYSISRAEGNNSDSGEAIIILIDKFRNDFESSGIFNKEQINRRTGEPI